MQRLVRNECAKMNAQRWRSNYVATALGYERGFIGASTLVIDFIVVDLFAWKALHSLLRRPPVSTKQALAYRSDLSEMNAQK